MKIFKKVSYIKILLVLLAFSTIGLIFKYIPNILAATVSLDEFNKYLMSLGKFGSIIIIFFQILQTVIAPIPGEVVQIASGYIYGVPLGLLFTMSGLIIGSAIAFYFTRLIGGNFITSFLKKKNSKWMLDIMESKKFSIILFVIFFVPGLPKDFLIYVAGLTTIKPIKFFSILVISRFPWLLASVSIGSNIQNGNYLSTIIISIIAMLSFLVGIIYKNEIINKFLEYKYNR
ncbi:TVP38/TMEM64 family protein [Clostridium gasigenes]|uniref:TVP38/TMEM64 family protein n=1 Tax=Clostridium gasigenes TaxID=94869 RepID=UPI001629B56A|nr:VTT domain-containing protein [Clostridium gasigenes]MBB6623355.1 TVP38/TMEM64 family protein [Clostridium gasigenes]MBU3088020.1 VTT domain-containing protein [Clostridium gasigenes]